MWNALAAEALPLVLDRLADPATAIIVSVTVVLLFGEAVLEAFFAGTDAGRVLLQAHLAVTAAVPAASRTHLLI